MSESIGCGEATRERGERNQGVACGSYTVNELHGTWSVLAVHMTHMRGVIGFSFRASMQIMLNVLNKK